MSDKHQIRGYLISIVVPVSALIVYCLHASILRWWLIDDAGISFSYAHNFIHGHGLVSQPGVPPVEGFSNFLWTILISPIFIFPPVNPAIPVKIFSTLCVFAAYLLLQKCITRHFADTFFNHWLAAVVILSLSLNSSFVVWTASGLENPLYALLAVLYFYIILEYERAEFPRHTMAAATALVGTMIGLTRPDGILFVFVFPLYLAIKLIADRSRYRTILRHALVFALVVGALYGGFMLFRYLYFHDTKPNPYYVKGGPTLGPGIELIMLARYYPAKTYDLIASMFSRRAGLVIVITIVLTILFMIKARKRMYYAILLLMLLASWAIFSLLPDDWMGEFRYATPVFVFYYTYLCLIVGWFLSYITKKSAIRAVSIIVLGIALVASTAILCIPRSRRFISAPPLAFHTVARLLADRFNCYADELEVEEASLLCPDAGGTLYFSRHRIYDLGGLCDRTIARALEKDTQGLKDYIFGDIKPTFIHIHDYWSWVTDLEHDPRFRRDYIAIREGVTTWARKRSKKIYHTGDYVRRDALSDPRLINRFDDGVGGDCGRPLEIMPFAGKPFPRR